MARVPLPIEECLDEIANVLEHQRRVVIVAPPGAGKTTGVAPRLLHTPIEGKVLLLQPRRMAARAVASRIAELLGCNVGNEVGYQVRMDRRWSKESKIVVMTYGVLLRRLQNDPLLEGFGTVLLDEFHERSLDSDLTLAMLHRVHTELRPDLAIGVMSATLDVQPIASYLHEACVIESRGQMFPVDVRYEKRPSQGKIDEDIARVLPRIAKETPGHILIFLPGVGEIRRTTQTLSEFAQRNQLELLQLYGDLKPQEQDRVLDETGCRKVILSTNVAETSITIPGVTAVIDSGLARVMSVDPAIGLQRLDLQPISVASADQRAGRAGRTAPGICHRLWLQASHRARKSFDLPEIQRGDITGAVLQLYGWGENDVINFPWLTPPSREAVTTAENLLAQLGAIHHGRITELGHAMLAIPAHPRLARMMLEARRYGILDEASLAAALLSERDPFIDARKTPRRPAGAFQRETPTGSTLPPSSNLLDRVGRVMRWARGESDNWIHSGGGKNILDAARQLRESVDADSDSECANPLSESQIQEALCRTLIAAFPDRVAWRREGTPDRGRMVGGIGVKLRAIEAPLDQMGFLCLDLLRKSADAEVRLAVPIDQDWLSGENRKQIDECFFHPSQKRVVGRRRDYWLDLVLCETPTEVSDKESAASALAEHLTSYWNTVFPSDDTALNQWLARLRFLSRKTPELGFEDFTVERLQEFAKSLCAGKLSIDEVRQSNWLDALKAAFDYQQLQTIEQWAPATIKIPSGKLVDIDYGNGDIPSISVRLQELFGWTKTPTIAQRRQPLLLRILAPNYREVQVTQDLENFWKVTYGEVRKEMRRRYPKHQWPEDPLDANATRSGLKRDEH